MAINTRHGFEFYDLERSPAKMNNLYACPEQAQRLNATKQKTPYFYWIMTDKTPYYYITTHKNRS